MKQNKIILFASVILLLFCSINVDAQRKHSTTSKRVSKSASFCPDSKHPHWIDMGLPSGTKWCCCNEGASTPESYGEYYKTGQVSSAPTLAQINELVEECSYEWTKLNGVIGGKFKGTNGGTIFLPAAGLLWDWGGFEVGKAGYYWSSTDYDQWKTYTLEFGLFGGGRSLQPNKSRRTVRPVQ